MFGACEAPALTTGMFQTVRRLALSALNSAARTKPHLIRDHMSAILPNLYQETVIRTELIRTVQMGPWTQKFDDGLEARKTAYETMYTLVSSHCTPEPAHALIRP
jgi:cullin-associated NEDD8-dissociated protein 1